MKCSLCHHNAIYHRRYSGEQYCRTCFIRSIERLTRHTIARYKMLSPRDHIALGLSGGKDSTALLHVLHNLEQKFPHAQLSAIIIDEGIRHYRNEAIQLAKESCQRFNVPYHLFSFKQLFDVTIDQFAEIPSAQRQVSTCSSCGIFRRKALNTAAKQINASKLVLAHNLDDELQSMFLSLLRGDLRSLHKIHPVLDRVPGFIPRIKPFSEILEKEIALYAYYADLPFQTLPCPYQTSSMRTNIRTFLNQLEHSHPGLKYSTYRNFKKVISTQSLDIQKTPTFCKLCAEPSANMMCRACTLLLEYTSNSMQ